MPISEVYNEDCMEGMKRYPDKFFDLAIVDPPYNVGIEYASHNDSMTNYYGWCDLWFNSLLRVSGCILLTGGYRNAAYWYNKNPKHVIIWIKDNQCSPSPLGGFNCYEQIYVFGNNLNRIGQDIYKIPIHIQPDAAFHPCPKSIKLWKRLLNDFGSPRCKIIEPFMGSQTGRIAAYNMGFDYWGYEIDKEYFDKGNKRFKEQTAQIKIF